MADIKQKHGTAAALTITIASLADGSSRGSTAIDNTSTLALAASIRVKIKTGAAGVNANGYIGVYLIQSEDGTNYDDGFGGTDAAFTQVNAVLLGTITANANATTYQGVFDTGLVCPGGLPKKWAIGLYNNTGAALDSTAGNHEVKYLEKYLQSV